jgi:hypothetical protein
MSNIPIFSYKQYLDDISKMTQQGTIGADRQAEAPRSAGSRGLKKVKNFIKDPVHMMGENTDPVRPGPANPNPNSVEEKVLDVPTPTVPELANKYGVSTKIIIEKLRQGIKVEAEHTTDFNTAMEIALDHLNEKLDYYELLATVEADTQEDIRKVKGGYRLVSKKTGRNLGTYPTRAGAEKRERQVQYFKHAGESRDDQSIAEVFESWLQRRIPEQFHEGARNWFEAKYQGRTVPLGKPMRGDVKKFKVYVKDPKTGNIKKVNFGHGGTSAKRLGQKTMKIKKSNPKRRKSFRARHNCDTAKDRTTARYWSCRAW